MDADELRWHLAQLPPGPWRVGERWFEVLDARGRIVLRVETANSRVLAPSLAALINEIRARPGLPETAAPAK